MKTYLATTTNSDLLEITLNQNFTNPIRAYYIVTDSDMGSAFQATLKYISESESVQEETLVLPFIAELGGKYYYSCTWKILLQVSTEISPSWKFEGPVNISGGSVEGMSTSTSTISGAIETVWCHPSDADTMLIGAVGGGVWKTTNAKSENSIQWENKSDELSCAITGLCSDIFDHTKLVACSGKSSSYGYGGDVDNGIIVSTDEGDTWIKKRIVVDGETKKLDLNSVVCWNDNILVASHRSGILSGNYSQYAGNAGIFLSKDFGDTWEMCSVPSSINKDYYPATSLSVCKFSDGSIKLYAGLIARGVFRSDDEGATWTDTTLNTPFLYDKITESGGNPPPNNNILLSECKTDPSVLYVMVVNNGWASAFGYTLNSGSTWLPMDEPTTYDTDGVSHYLHPTTKRDGTPKPNGKSGGQGNIHGCIYAHPSISNIVFAGGDRQPELGGLMENQQWSGRLFRGDRNFAYDNLTTDGYSQQWSHITHVNTINDESKYGGLVRGGTANASAPHADSRWMAFDADGNLIEVDDGGIYKLTDPLGNTGDWYSLCGDLCVIEVHSMAYDRNNDKVLVGSQDNGTILGNALSAESLWGGDGGDCHVIQPDQNTTSYVYSSQNGYGLQIDNPQSSTDSFYLSWAWNRTQFTPKTALNEITNKHIAVEILAEENITGGIYVSDISNSNSANSASRKITASEYNDETVFKILHGHTSNEDALFVASKKHLVWRFDDIISKIDFTNDLVSETFNREIIYYMDVHKTNINKIILTTGVYDWNWGEMFSEDTDDNNLFIVDIETNSKTKVDIPYNHTRTCQYVNDRIFVGHSQGVAEYHISSNTWTDMYPNSLPNVLVHDMIYDTVSKKLVVGTMGRGVFSLDIE